MQIDIDGLTEPELRDLNRRIVERLRFMQEVRTHAAMLHFRIGDRVEFDTADGMTVVATIVRYNRKTVSLVTDAGQRWRASPGALRPVVSVSVEVVHPERPLQLPRE